MARQVLYFDEYMRHDSTGSEIHPYYDPVEKSWYDDTYKLTLKDLGKLYDIDEDELVVLALTYGP
jgi:hypothetical protein